MGFMRGGIVISTGVLLLLSLLAGNLFLTLVLSLKYDNVKLQFGEVIRDIAESEMNLTQQTQEDFPVMQSHCEIQNNTEYVFKHEESGYVFVIPCEIVLRDTDKIIEFETQYLLDEVYYEDYDCGFLDCFKKTEMPFFLISEHAKNYWQSKFYISLLISGILVLLMLFFIEHKRKLFFVVGALIMISSLPFAKLEWLFLSFGYHKSILQIFSILFTQAHKIFLIMFIAGIIIFGIGIGLRLLGFGLKLWNFIPYSKKAAQQIEQEKLIKTEEKKKIKSLNKKISKVRKDLNKMKLEKG